MVEFEVLGVEFYQRNPAHWGKGNNDTVTLGMKLVRGDLFTFMSIGHQQFAGRSSIGKKKINGDRWSGLVHTSQLDSFDCYVPLEMAKWDASHQDLNGSKKFLQQIGK